MNETNRQQDSMPQINRALGLFLLCFGVIVLVAVFFTETRTGKMTNLAAGLIFSVIGLLMVFRSKTGSGPS